ncbi:pullulanase [Paenibacillus sanfengchensis]|uniref:pullulanase n=2 Tax=Paenibacillus TaxID=44249 RepID=UPI003A5C6E71
MRLNAPDRRIWVIILAFSMVVSMIWIPPAVKANTDHAKVVVTGDLQTHLGSDTNWDPAAAATEMTYLGDGEYRFTGTLPAGTFEYKVAIDGDGKESYGIDHYSHPDGMGSEGNIQLRLPRETEVTFYYNHHTHRIADSTFYKPLPADRLPRVIGSFQHGTGESENGSSANADLILKDADYDHVYSVTADVYAGLHEFQISLGNEPESEIYPTAKEPLHLTENRQVIFLYDVIDHTVSVDYAAPVSEKSGQMNPVPANHLRVHYKRTDGNYRNLGLWLFEDVAAPSANWPAGATVFPDGQMDTYGAYVDIPLAASSKKVGMVIVNTATGDKDGGDKTVELVTPQMNEVWLKEGTDTAYSFEPAELPANTVRIHYVRQDQQYDAFGVWLWGDAESPSSGWPTGATMFTGERRDSYGAYVDVKLKSDAQRIGFLVLDPSKGDAGKDAGDKSFTMMDRFRHLFIKEGNNTVYVSPYGEIPTGLVSAEVAGAGKLRLSLTSTDGLEPETLKRELRIMGKDGQAITVQRVHMTGETSVEVEAQFTLDEIPLQVTYAGKTVLAASGWRMLDELYEYDGDDLGATYRAGGAELKLWAPLAEKVSVQVYHKDDAARPAGAPIELAKGDKGVWSLALKPGDLGIPDFKGYFYQYEVTHNGTAKKVLDPYAKSMAEFRVNTRGEAGPDGDPVGKAAIVDLSQTDPPGYDFADIPGYEQREDAVIWEIHVRDFTSDPAIAADLHQSTWGTYDAFTKKLEYIKSLGVTHIQLLPVMAWYNGDEANMKNPEAAYSTQDNQYNWGYDPHSYFSPDGAYSEDPADPHLRIKELKAMIHAIHEAGMGVILDVAYTHMAKADFLNDIVPNYYAFQDQNGNFLGGFGNNLATNRKMAEKLMIDSVKYWFTEYKIDGMRFDMMGDATYEAIQNAYNAASGIHPKALFIGEGWKTFSGAVSDPSLAGKGADQDWMDQTDDVGVFSDEFRNELKSGYGNEGEPRFITGGARDIQTIFKNIKAQPGNTPADDPGDMVQYIEAHDNLTLHDIIAQATKKDPAVPANEAEILKRLRLGNLLTLVSQGTAFLHAGQEYGRTKQWLGEGVPEQKYHELRDENGKSFGYFIHDSYDSSDAVNKFDWTKATDADTFPEQVKTKEYTAGLIELRKSTDAFRLGGQTLVNTNVTLLQIPEISTQDLVIAFKNKATDGTGNYYVFVNADNKARKLSLSEDLTSGAVLVDNDEAGKDPVTVKSGFTLTGGSITLEPLTAVIIRTDAAAAVIKDLSVDKDSYALPIGKTHQTAVYANYEDGGKRTVTKQAVYASSDPKVASVTSSGLVQGNAEGVAVISVTYGGFRKEITVTVTADSVDAKRYVQLNYIRPDRDYTNWNLWVWNTGVKNDEIRFDRIENGIATALIEVSPDATNVGFVLRKGTDWSTAKQDIPDDRIIPLLPGEGFTKINVTSMVHELDILPSILGPVLEDGNITFLYRDDKLFREGRLDTISEVKVVINGKAETMRYIPEKEWFSYTLKGAAPGTYEYTFLVTRDGVTRELTDPKNTVNGKSVLIFSVPKVTVKAEVNPGAFVTDENAVLRIEAITSESVTFKDAYIDLSELGGPVKAKLDPQLLKQSIAVKDTVTPGNKSIPVTLVDQYGNRHTGTAKVTVKTRAQAGESDDFDWDEARIYFILTDRFMDGDPANNADVDKNHLEAYHGGDFRGLIDKLDYIDKLGINTLWITPIVDNIDYNVGAGFNGKQYGYHGYWAKDFTRIDEHLGDMETFKELIDKAHDRGIKIMVDVVLNHTGYGLKPGDDAPGITRQDKERFAGKLRTDGVSADTDPVKGELAGLPDLLTEDPLVRQQVIEWQAGWLERARTDRGDTIDYFRVDTVKHVDDTTWKSFKNALTAIDTDFKLIGEYFGATVQSDGGQLQSGTMDSLLDFGFKQEARKLANGDVESVEAYLAEREAKLDNTRMMGQFLSSHDEDGFLTHYVNGDKGKMMAAAAMQITSKGQPVIYYGEELGRSGKNAGDISKGEFGENRSDMPWDRLEAEKKLLTHYQKLLNIRADHSKVFSKGVRTPIAASNKEGYLAFAKQYGGEQLVTAIHVKNEAKQVTLPVPFTAGSKVKDLYGGTEYRVSSERKVTVTLQAMTEGGTVILAPVPAGGGDSGSGGSSSSGNTGAGVPTASMADNWPAAANRKIVSGQALQAGTSNVTIFLEAGDQEVLLPRNAGEILVSRSLELKRAGVVLTIPSKVLQAVEKHILEAPSRDAFISIKLRELAKSELDPLWAKVADSDIVRRGSGMIDLGIAVITKDGTKSGPEQFPLPVTISLDPDGHIDSKLAGIYRVTDDGSLIYIPGQRADGKLVADIAHAGHYAVLELNKAFADLTGHWAESAVKQLAARHIVNGTGGSEFNPGRQLTRAEFAAMLVRGLNLNAQEGGIFNDTESSAWYASAVGTAQLHGLINGKDKGVFAPNDPITREEMAVMLVRAYRMTKEAIAASESMTYTDGVQVSVWAAKAVREAGGLGLMKGQGNGKFSPKAYATRAESAQAMLNLLTKLEMK